MANNYEAATVQPFFPQSVALAHVEALGKLGVSVEDGVGSGNEAYLYVEDGCSDWDETHAILQAMLKEAGMACCWVEGCFYCDKMRPGEFGGFAHFITPDDVQFVVTGGWVEKRRRALKSGGRT